MAQSEEFPKDYKSTVCRIASQCRVNHHGKYYQAIKDCSTR